MHLASKPRASAISSLCARPCDEPECMYSRFGCVGPGTELYHLSKTANWRTSSLITGTFSGLKQRITLTPMPSRLSSALATKPFMGGGFGQSGARHVVT